MRCLLYFLSFGLVSLLLPVPAWAHPHAWITYRTTIMVNAAMEAVAIRQSWQFDAMYSVFALEDFDPNQNGKSDPAELEALAKENLTHLKDFHYFTVLENAEGKATKLGMAKDIKSYLVPSEDNEGKGVTQAQTETRQADGSVRFDQSLLADPKALIKQVGHIVMEFTVPLSQPVSLMGEGTTYRIYDPTYYTDMGHQKLKPISFVAEATGVKLSNCSGKVITPKIDPALLLKAAALDKSATAPPDLGYYFSEKAILSCTPPISSN